MTTDENDDDWNIAEYDVSTGTTSYIVFDYLNYEYREQCFESISSSATSSCRDAVSDFGECDYSTGYVVQDEQEISVPSSVLGDDDRSIVENTTVSPYKKVGYLAIGSNSCGTAFLEGSDLIVTAAHCVYDRDASAFHEPLSFIPGKNGSAEPYGSVSVTKIYIGRDYYEENGSALDWACCLLEEPIGNTLGWFGKYSNFYEENYDVVTYGYPGDFGGYMAESRGRLTYFEEDKGYYRTDYDSYFGQSGSPIIAYIDGTEYVIGIHTYGTASYNGGVRINSFVFHFFNSFVSSRTTDYISLEITEKSSSVWSIAIGNNCSYTVTAYYNSRMCFLSDAENWSGLSDIVSIELDAGKSETVLISENFFATTIATSFTVSGSRWISYANNLSSVDKTLSLYHNKIQEA